MKPNVTYTQFTTQKHKQNTQTYKKNLNLMKLQHASEGIYIIQSGEGAGLFYSNLSGPCTG